MPNNDPTFVAASDSELARLVINARHRLVLACPAITKEVSHALRRRIEDLAAFANLRLGIPPRLRMTLILDDDPEVYRLGYGTEHESLAFLRKAADRGLIHLGVEHGMRIGICISDDKTAVFCPTPQLVEDTDRTANRGKNAILLFGAESDRLARATGHRESGSGEEVADAEEQSEGLPETQELGTQPFTAEKIAAVNKNLNANPPLAFDLARRIRVFSAKVKFVEFHALNYRIGARRVKLPTELLGIADRGLSGQVTSSLGMPEELLGPQDTMIETDEQQTELRGVDEKWFANERKRIEDQYTFLVPRYGRVIFNRDRQAFDKEIERFRRNLGRHHEMICQAVDAHRKTLAQSLFDEFLPRLEQRPPPSFARYQLEPTKENLKSYLWDKIQALINKALTIKRPEVRIVFKGIAPESVDDTTFIEELEKSMKKKKVPQPIIDSLFESSDAASAREPGSA